jgi:serine/threonine protein kinase|eukprot:g1467.t1
MGQAFRRRVNPLDVYRPTEVDEEKDSSVLRWIAHPQPKGTSGKTRWEKVKGFVHNYRSLGIKQFKLNCIVGRGAIGTVYLCKFSKDKQYYAMKSMRRSSIIHRQAADRVRRELEILKKMRFSPFVAHLFGAFQNEKHVCFLLEYGFGGELYTLLCKHSKLGEGTVKFFVAELVIALTHLHSSSVVYRDLKPDNIVLDENGHVRLVDFGLAAYVDNDGFCESAKSSGTAQYLAPEITRGFKERHGVAVDWWALGVLAYELLYGKPPFGERPANSKYEIFTKINSGNYKFPRRPNVSMECKNVIKGLLTNDFRKRYASDEVINSAWCRNLDWNLVQTQSLVAPIVPRKRGKQILEGDHSNFKKWKEPRYQKSANLTSAEKAYSNICGTPESQTKKKG